MRDSRLRVFFAPMSIRISSAILLALLGLVILGPLVLPWNIETIDWTEINTAPSSQHWFGTDSVGRDLFVRTLVGTRVSLMITLLAAGVSFVIGLPFGASSGYFGGSTDQVMMRIVDGLYAIPYVLIVIVLVVLLGRNLYLLFVAIGAVSWLDIARIVRGQALVVKAEPFVLAARSVGLTESAVVLRHIIPNVLGTAIVFSTLMIPSIIIAESFISFLGLGVQEPMTSLGVLIAEGSRNIHASPWQLAFPTAIFALLLILFTLLGERLRELVSSTRI